MNSLQKLITMANAKNYLYVQLNKTKMLQWQTKVIYTDHETGEILDPSIAKDKYIIINQFKTYQHDKNKNINTRIIYKQCRRTNQLRIF